MSRRLPGQKFMPGEDEDCYPILSDRHSIVVIADEAHRTQYGFEAKFKGDGKSTTVDWSVRENVRAKLRLMVKRILRKYKYPPDHQEIAVQLVLDQAETLSAEWP
jgi:type I site-specific restriction-modification system R (restriction) subunit